MNGLRTSFDRSGVKLGHYVGEFVTPGIGHILKATGCEFVFFDMEHSAFGFETLKAALRYFEAAGLPAMVRIPSKSPDHVSRAMDCGAEGLVVPMLSSAAEARQILDAMKYTPLGRRGVALAIAHDNYRPGPVLEKLAEANRRSLLVALVETREGIAEADAIAATEGVDVLWIGHFDLSCSLGIPGQFDHPDFRAAVAAVERAAKRHGKHLGRMVTDIESGIALARAGYDLICYHGDVWLLQQALREGIAAIRAGLGEGAA
ncbi:5-keto-4-deoxy-D-glucarate aldolase [bacterium HR40]|nr:5-keto-4-deoxy-D-glucarate aldolase [bacterium HR40]